MRNQKSEKSQGSLKIVLYSVILLFLMGCSSEEEYTIIRKEQPPLPAISIAKVFLETSLSMKGYVDALSGQEGDFSMKRVIPFLVTDLDNEVVETQLYTITDEPKRYTKSNSDFFANLRNGQLFTGKSSRLHRIFTRLIDSTQAGEITLLISDCILDLGSGNLRDRDILTSQIYQFIRNRQDLAVLVYQYVSDFNGTYYYNRENDQPFRGQILKNRPYYIWVFGDPASIQNLLSREIIVDYEKVYSFGLRDVAVNPTLLSSPSKGRIIFKPEENSFNPSGGYPVEVTLGLNSSRLPKANTENLSLGFGRKNEHVSLSLQNKEDVEKQINPRLKEEVLQLIDTKNLDKFVKLTLDKPLTTVDHLDIIIDNPTPNWIMQSDLNDDFGIEAEQLEGKTFSLQYIYDAFERAYKEKNASMATIEIEIK